MDTPDPEAERTSPGRRAVLVIFGGVVLVFVVAGYLATQFRAGTRERLVPPHPTSTTGAPDPLRGPSTTGATDPLRGPSAASAASAAP